MGDGLTAALRKEQWSDGEAGSTAYRIEFNYPVICHPPVAQAGYNPRVAVGEPVQLDGTFSVDPDGDPLTFYAWSITSAPPGSTAQLTESWCPWPTLTPDVPGSYFVSLTVGDAQDVSSPSPPVVIIVEAPPTTPTLVWSMGLGNVMGNAVAVDPFGNVFVTGQAGEGSRFTERSTLLQPHGRPDRDNAFVAKFSAGSATAWSVVLGDDYDRAGIDVAVDAGGNIYVLDLAFEAEIRKLSRSGILLWTLRVPDCRYAVALAVDAAGCVYVVGNHSYPGPGSSSTAIVSKVSAGGDVLWSADISSTYPTETYGYDLAVDAAGNIYITGNTTLGGWASGGYDLSYDDGGCDAFVAKFNSGGELLWSTYVGGPGWDEGRGIAVDDAGHVYVTGRTSADGWAAGGFDVTQGGQTDAFCVKLSSDGAHLWSTHLGGAAEDAGLRIAVGPGGAVYVVGQTRSSDWVAGGPDTTLDGVVDGFVARLSDRGGLLWSSYVAGSVAQDVAVDGLGHCYVVGYDSAGWGSERFVWKLADPPPPTGDLQVVIEPPAAVTAGARWRIGDGPWYASGGVVALPAGQHPLEFLPLDGWITPAPQTLTITAAQTLQASGSYTAVQGLPPVADAGPDQRAAVGQLVHLDGSESRTERGAPPSAYLWALLATPPGSAAQLSDPSAARPTFRPDVAGMYEVGLTVADGVLWSAPDAVTVEARPVYPVGSVLSMKQEFGLYFSDWNNCARLAGDSVVYDCDREICRRWFVPGFPGWEGYPGGDESEYGTVDSSQHPSAFDVSGPYIVYLGYRDGYAQIRYGLLDNLEGGANSRIVRSPAPGKAPVISGQIILFHDFDDAVWWDLDWDCGRSLDNRSGSKTDLAIDGNLAAWSVTEAGQSDIRARFLGDNAADSFAVTATPTASELFPSVSGTRIAYNLLEGQYPQYSPDIGVTDVATGQTWRVTEDEYYQLMPMISGDYVYYEDARSGNRDIYVHDLATGDTYQLTDGPEDDYLRDAEGRRVVFFRDHKDQSYALWVLDWSVNRPPVVEAGPDVSAPSRVLGPNSWRYPRVERYWGVHHWWSDPDGDDFLFEDVDATLESAPSGESEATVGVDVFGWTITVSADDDYWRPGDYVISLRVFDGLVWSAPDSFTIHVYDASGSGMEADAGADRVAPLGPIWLDGSRSGADPSGKRPRGFRWTLVSKPEGSAATLSATDVPQPRLLADCVGEYVLTLEVRATDLTEWSPPDTMTITAQDWFPLGTAPWLRLTPAAPVRVGGGDSGAALGGDWLVHDSAPESYHHRVAVNRVRSLVNPVYAIERGYPAAALDVTLDHLMPSWYESSDAYVTDVNAAGVVATATNDRYWSNVRIHWPDGTTDLVPPDHTYRTWQPALSGNSLVFTALQAGGSDIYHYDLASGAQSPVATKSFVEQAPAIDGNLVAWEVVQGAASDIWARRLDGQSFRVATSAACEDQPAVGGSDIAYRIDGQDIAVYDEQTGQTVRVTDDAYVQQSPRVADGLVYYMDNRAGNFDLYAYDLARGCTYQLTDEPHDQYLGDADGDRIAYHDNRSGANDVFLLGVRMNRPPVADAGADFVMDHQPEAKLLRGGSDPDPEDGPRNPDAIAHFDVCWHIVSAPVGCGQALAVPQDQYYGQYVDYNETGDAWFRPRVDGQYVISLALFDGIDWGEPDTVTITVTGASNAPVVDAGPDREVEVGYNARLFGSYHSDYAVREIVWSILLAPDGSTAELDYYFGPLSPELLPDVAGTYVIQLRVVDENGVWGEDWVTLVAWYNARPHVYAGADREVEIGQLVELHAVAWDPENDPIVAWRWQLNNVPDGSLAELSDDWIQDPTFVPDVPGLYELRAWAYDDAPGAHAGHDDMVVTATPVVNDAPIANAGPDQFAYPGRVVPLEGSAWDEEGSPITAWEWTVQSAPPGSTATLSNPASQTPTFTPDLVGEYVLALRAHDDENWGEPDTMTITTLDQSPPVAVAGPDRVAPVNTPVPLDGVASYDPDGDVITRYQWTLVSVPPGSAAELADAQAVVADLLADVPGAYVVALEVYDGRFWSAADSVTVTVQDYFPLGSAPGVTVSDTPVDRDGRGEATISGDVIVYSKIVNMNNDLYWCEVGGGAGALITAAGNQFWPDISGTGVAYTDDSTGMLDIWYCDVRTQEKYRVSPSWMSDYEPAISGTNIVYTSTQNFNEDVYWYSTVKHAELPLANTSNAERFPAIDGELVAWVVYEGGNANIRARFLEQPPFAVAVTAAAEMYPSVSGLRIAYQVDYDIAVYDHATGQTRRMAPVASDLRNVTLSGDKLYYTGTRASSYDVFLHDLATGNTYQLTTGKLAVLSDADGTRAVYDPGSGVAGGVYLIEVAFNHRPVADAGPDRDALTEAAVQLNGSASSDPDGDVLVGHFWTIMDAPASSTARLSDPHAIDPTFTPEVAGSYTVGLCVSDGGLWSAVDRVVITAAHVNHAPTADAGPDQAARVGEVVQLDGAGSSDPDPGDEWLTYHWVISVKPSSSTAVLSAPSIRNPTFTPDVPGTFVIELMVFDGEVWSAPDTVTLTVRLPNRPPVAIAGANQNVMTHALVQLHGAGYDADHDPIAAWSWQLTSQPAGSPAQLSDPAIRSPTFTAHWPGEYVLELIVSDGLLWSAPAEVRVTAEQNHTPVAVAGPNQTVHAGEIVQLDGSGSGDPDGQPIAAWKWTMSRRPAGSLAALSDPAIPKPTFQTDLPGRYEVWLDVWDESGAQGQSHYPVVVEALQPNQPPIAEAGEDQRVAVGRVVCLDAIGSIDPDGDAIIAWAWQFLELPAGSAATLSDANTGQPTFTPDVVGEYVVSLVVQAEHNEAWSLPDALWVIATEPTANTFDAGAEGWRWADLEADGPYPTVYQTGEVTWQAEGGNPGGCIAVADPGPEAVFFAAPASWLGPKGQAYGTNLTFDLRASGSGTGSSLIPEIVLVGAGRSIVANLQVVSASPSWQTFALPLSEAGWKYDDPDTGAPVTPEDFRAVLADLERLYLCADYVAEPETTYLDNVRMFVSASGDFDGDGDVDESDAAIFEDCLAGPEYARPPVCMVGDLDGDGDVDLADFALLQSVYTGPG